MKRWLPCAAGLWLVPASSALAQDATYQKEKPFQFKLDALARGEWTRDIYPLTPTTAPNDDRQRFQARPALEAHFGPVRLGVGAEFNYSSDKNYETATGAPPTIIRDNYKSRDARVDLAFAEYESSWLHVQGGRFEMPVALTEMIWDKDLRPQGGAVTLGVKDKGAVKRAGITGLWARGSHVFDDGDATMSLVSANVVFRTGETGSLELVGSYIDFSNFQDMQIGIRRQNTRVAGQLVLDYNVMDFVGRFRRAGTVPVQLVAEYGWNTAVDANNQGLWLAAVLGSLQSGMGGACGLHLRRGGQGCHPGRLRRRRLLLGHGLEGPPRRARLQALEAAQHPRGRPLGAVQGLAPPGRARPLVEALPGGAAVQVLTTGYRVGGRRAPARWSPPASG